MDKLQEWINPQYLTAEAVKAIAAQFEKEGLVQMHKFLVKEVELKDWGKKQKLGEWNYSAASLPAFFSSEEFNAFISLFTNTTLKKNYLEAQSFGHREYSVLSDDESDLGIFVHLDLTKAWGDDWGGYTSIIEDEEIVRLLPEYNVLTVVSQSNNTKHFVKYVNHLAEGKKIVISGVMK